MKENIKNYWIISDTHFNHIKLDEWGERSGDWQTTIWMGLDCIPKGDILIHLGDIAIGNDQEVHKLISALQCKKILIRGNHDKKSANWYLNNGWDFVCDGLDLLFQGYYLFLSHRPIPTFSHYNYNIHGHTHGNLHRSEEYVSYYDKNYHKDISPELVGYIPLRLDTFIKSFTKK